MAALQKHAALRFGFAHLIAIAAVFVAGQSVQAGEKPDKEPRRSTFKIDPLAPAKNLLPLAPKTAPVLPPYLNEDLALMPELSLAQPFAKILFPTTSMKYLIAKINYLNDEKEDGFLHVLLENRSDLRGLPFLMGKDCRTEEKPAQVFAEVAELVHQSRERFNEKEKPDKGAHDYWKAFRDSWAGPDAKYRCAKDAERAKVAALMQVFGPKTEVERVGLAKYLTTVEHVEATQALAKLAIFSYEQSVRSAAIDALKARPVQDYKNVLMQGFRYPLPAVSKRASEALVELGCKDVLVDLVSVLEQPDPRAPIKQKVAGKEETVVREVVRVNHHRNCLLCHAPANTPGVPTDVLTVPVPLQSEPLDTDGGGYQRESQPSPDIFVRIDMTYLRQDFSMMMRVENAHPWPEMQRFDFLVRTRVLNAEEAKACATQIEKQRTPPSHVAATYALRELTGQAPAEQNAQAWRRLLNLPTR